MNKILIIISTFIICTNVFSQGEGKVELSLGCYDSLKSENTTLKKQDTLHRENIKSLNDSIVSLNNSIKKLNKSINGETEKVKQLEREKNDLNNKLKSSSIKTLEKDLNKQKDSVKLLLDTIRTIPQKEETARKKGKEEILASLADFYKKPLDTLLQFITKETLQRDKKFLEDNKDINQKIADLEAYFNAKELLERKFNASAIASTLPKLQIKEKSAKIDELKQKIEKYKQYNDNLKETIREIQKIDKEWEVKGMSQKMQDEKYLKISEYIFNYDFNLVDYPHLSKIILNIIKDKFSNPDKDIQEHLNNL
jgi:DNA repair exonuclease SbcCD ATPase subunit